MKALDQDGEEEPVDEDRRGAPAFCSARWFESALASARVAANAAEASNRRGAEPGRLVLLPVLQPAISSPRLIADRPSMPALRASS